MDHTYVLLAQKCLQNKGPGEAHSHFQRDLLLLLPPNPCLVLAGHLSALVSVPLFPLLTVIAPFSLCFYLL